MRALLQQKLSVNPHHSRCFGSVPRPGRQRDPVRSRRAAGRPAIPPHSHADLEVLLLPQDRLRQPVLQPTVRAHQLRGREEKRRSGAGPSRGSPAPRPPPTGRGAGPAPAPTFAYGSQAAYPRGEGGGGAGAAVAPEARPLPLRRGPRRRRLQGRRTPTAGPGAGRGKGRRRQRRTYQEDGGAERRELVVGLQHRHRARRDSNRSYATRRANVARQGRGAEPRVGRGCVRACALGPPGRGRGF